MQVARFRLSWPVMAVAAALSGCTYGAEGSTHEVVTRDSAGISIVENRGGALPVLRIATDPAIQIGEMEGRAEYQLHDVRHGTRLSDGTVVIANNGSGEVRFYDTGGRHMHSSGRRGGGPGEFQYISYMRRLTGDTVLVYDSRNRRVTLLGPDGAYARDFTPALPGGGPFSGVAAATADGALLVSGGRSFPSGSVTFHRDTLKYNVVRGDNVLALPPYGGMEATIRTDGSGSNFTVMISEVAFGRTTHVSAGPDRFYIGSNDTYEVHAYDADGTLRAILRSSHVPVQQVDGALFARFSEAAFRRREQFATAQGQEFDAAAMKKGIEETPRSPTVPLYADLLASDDGGVWVKDYVMPASEGQRERWTIFRADGTIRGVVDMPLRFRPMHASASDVTGVITDEYDVQYVHVYSIDE